MPNQYRHVPMSYFDSLADARRTLRENSLTALELQLSLLEWLQRSAAMPGYQQFMTTYGHRKITDAGTKEMLGEFLHRQIKDTVSVGSTHYVSNNMSEVIKCAAVDMPDSGLRAHDLPTDTGFLVFENPVSLFMDGDEEELKEVRITAVAWQVGTVRRAPLKDEDTSPTDGQLVPGISYYLFQSAHDAVVLHNRMRPEEDRHTEDEMRRDNGPLPIFDFSGWAYNTPWRSVSEKELAGRMDDDGRQFCQPIVDQARRLLLATWRIFKQKNYVVRDPNTPPRAMRKRGERIADYEPGDIMIIRMRTEVYQSLQAQAKEAGESDDTPWYKCQFMVRGHWHPYWTGARVEEKCEHDLQPIPDSDDSICTRCGRILIEKYILPYPKGNPNGPLQLRDHIFKLDH
jgi:hypothetical protein